MKRAKGEYSTGYGNPDVDVWEQRLVDARKSTLPAHRPQRDGSHGDEDILSPIRVEPLHFRDVLFRNRKKITGECPKCGQIFLWEGQVNTWNLVEGT